MKSRMKPALRVGPAAQVQLSLNVQGVLRDVQQAFYGLCVNTGKQVLAAMMEADRVAVCGAKNVPDPGRKAVRGGTTRSSVVLGGQRIAVSKPRARSLEHGELELPTFAWAANTAAGGPTSKKLSPEQKVIDRKTRLTISRELGHEREQITAIYLGRESRPA